MRKNREEDLAYKRKWARENRGRIKGWSLARKEHIRLFLKDHKEKSGCLVCGISDPVVLVFHHRNPEEKESTLANLQAQASSMDKVRREIEKCEVVCANCHLKIHAGKISI